MKLNVFPRYFARLEYGLNFDYWWDHRARTSETFFSSYYFVAPITQDFLWSFSPQIDRLWCTLATFTPSGINHSARVVHLEPIKALTQLQSLLIIRQVSTGDPMFNWISETGGQTGRGPSEELQRGLVNKGGLSKCLIQTSKSSLVIQVTITSTLKCITMGLLLGCKRMLWEVWWDLASIMLMIQDP